MTPSTGCPTSHMRELSKKVRMTMMMMMTKMRRRKKMIKNQMI
jgi:hypothetical protein